MLKKSILLVLFFLLELGLYMPHAISQQGLAVAEEELKILTWNIYMLPRQILKTGQLDRAKAIVEQLKDKTFDIIVFQEAFDKKSCQIICDGLKEFFPYQSNPGGKEFLKVNSGVLILSKHVIIKQKQITFRSCVGNDCLANKGATLVEVAKSHKKFQVIGTHLQSEVRNQRYKTNRRDQYNEINEFLIKPNLESGVPQFVVGDLNTPENITDEYKTMLKDLECQDAERNSGEWEQQASWGAWSNDMFDECSDRKAEVLDYILYKPNGKSAARFQKSIRRFCQLWNGKNKDLSDHYAVEAVVKW